MLVPLTLAIVIGLFYISGAQAVHDAGVFELDANALNDPVVPGQDWDDVYTARSATPPGCPAGSEVCSFTHEELNTTIFTTGGSKDDLDTSRWRHKDGSVPDKDDLADAYAVRYAVPGYDPDGTGPKTDSDIIYFGTDRLSNDGDAALGFWFFQSDITALAGGTFGPGVHQDGDLLVISDFSGGGSDVSISVYQWNGPGGTISGSGAINGTLDLLVPLGAADCTDQGPNDPVCGTVNDGTTDSPWPFLDKGNSADFRQGEFFEGGLNLSFLNLEDECFTSFLAETRSSTSINAQLKDFVSGRFAVCQATMATLPKLADGTTTATSVSPGTPVHDLATVTGNNPAQTPSGTVEFFLCSFASGSTATCDGTTNVGTSIGTDTLSGSGAVATAESVAVNTAAVPLSPGHYCFRAEWPGDTNYVGAKEADGALECFDVTVHLTKIQTAQFFYPNDTATVATQDGVTNLPAGGTVLFKAYNSSANCTANGATGLYFQQSVGITGGSPSENVTTTNTTIKLPPTTEVWWRVTYSPNSTAFQGRTSICVENTALTITDAAFPGSAP
jgi:hypothetical protein